VYHSITIGEKNTYDDWHLVASERPVVVPAAPKMMGFEAEGAAAIVKGERIMNPETLATAIRIGNPASWQKAEAARDESNGMINFVTDDEILSAYKLLASSEGVLAEPASAASVAGLIKVKSQVKEGSKIVCILTGNGLKDPDNAIKYGNSEVKKAPAELDAVMKIIMG
jgi:threonine synthase